ncbi:DUF1127 domain-containing protein [Sinorhizobium mexicanum]|uniref:DUF1127 domain-containing protein n=1 Tax=Sinorhizobium mexicanum TaxID=375549 RepID=A0A859QN85_9HYPH|nr:DUF1127 domain-containing protein [Sinorhizobium mexicanum]MBP1882081.1 uncharacterized protein YjiS (DUF1127 family) [Sinorhizobium mexicanum]QLL61806.1 DUF1127 domain-containing protein [Sinorhizobium mexicanum]
MNTIVAIQSLRPRAVAPRNANFACEHQGPARNVFSRLWRRYCALAAMRRSRLALDELSKYQLDDIGVTEEEARREAAVPFWRSRLL